MCVVSAVGDYWRRDFPKRHPGWEYDQPIFPGPIVIPQEPQVSKKEFDALKKEMKELKKLLLAAKHFDEANGEPDCEMDDKVALIKAIAKKVGVNMDEVFK